MQRFGRNRARKNQVNAIPVTKWDIFATMHDTVFARDNSSLNCLEMFRSWSFSMFEIKKFVSFFFRPKMIFIFFFLPKFTWIFEQKKESEKSWNYVLEFPFDRFPAERFAPSQKQFSHLQTDLRCSIYHRKLSWLHFESSRPNRAQKNFFFSFSTPICAGFHSCTQFCLPQNGPLAARRFDASIHMPTARVSSSTWKLP